MAEEKLKATNLKYDGNDIAVKYSAYDIDGNYITKAYAKKKYTQEPLISGYNIKTINGESILGSGNLEISIGNSLGSLSAVALSGSYSDLSDKPINLSEFINDRGFITSSALNAYALKTSIPTKISSLINDAGFIDNTNIGTKIEEYLAGSTIPTYSSLATVATTGSYSDLKNKPTIPTKLSQLTDDKGYVRSSTLSLTLANYALSSDIPTDLSSLNNDTNFISRSALSEVLEGYALASSIPSSISSLTNDAGYLTSVSWNDIQNKPTIPTVPTNISAFANDAGYLTEHQPLAGYATEEYVNNAVNSILGEGEITETYNTIKEISEYIGTHGSEYSNLVSAVNGKQDALVSGTNIKTINNQSILGSGNISIVSADSVDWSNVTNKPTLFSGSYDDLTNKPTIPTVPTNISDFTNDAGYLTTHQDIKTINNQSLVGDGNIDIQVGPIVIPFTSATSLFGTSINEATLEKVSGDNCLITWRNLTYRKISENSNYIYYENTTVDSGTVTTRTIRIAKSSGSLNNFTSEVSSGSTNLSDFTNDAGFLTSVEWNDVENKPTFATVATSGSYSDLTNKPTIPAAISDLNNDVGYISSVSWTDIIDRPTNVSTFTNDSGYITSNALSGLATESYVNTQIGTLLGTGEVAAAFDTFKEIADYLTQHGSDYANLVSTVNGKADAADIITTTSGLTNDAGFITNSVNNLTNYTLSSALSAVATSGSYNDLTNKPSLFSGSYNDLTDKPIIPTIPTNVSDFTNDAGYISGVDWDDVGNKPSLFSGDYNDLTNKPTIPTVSYPVTDVTVDGVSVLNGTTAEITLPTNISSFTNDAGYLTSVSWNDVGNKPSLFSGDYNDLTNKPTIPTVPTNISAFTNDSGYITSSSLSGLATETYVDTAINNILGSGTISQSFDTIKEIADYLTTHGSDYANLVSAVNGKADASDIPTDLGDLTNNAGYIKSVSWSDVGSKPTFATVATSGSYADLTNKPTIPADTGDLTNNAGFLTSVSWNDIQNKPTIANIEKTPLVETTPSSAITIDPFKVYDFGTVSSGIVVTLGTTGKVTGYCTEYCFRFTASTGCAITLPVTCKFSNGNNISVFTEGHVYEYNIIDNLVAIGEFY